MMHVLFMAASVPFSFPNAVAEPMTKIAPRFARETSPPFIFHGATADLLTSSGEQGDYPVKSVPAPLDGTGIIVFSPAPPERDALLKAVAECLNAEWNHGDSLKKNEPNSIRISVSARAFEQRLWTRLLTEGQKDLSRFAQLSRRPVSYWQRRSVAPKQEGAEPLLPGSGNLKFLILPNWHASLRLYDSLNPSQRRALVADGHVLVSPTSAQAELLRSKYTTSGPYYHDSQERTITREEHLRIVEGQVASWRQTGYRLDVRRDPVTRMATQFPPFDIPHRDWLPFPVRGCPYTDAEGKLRTEPSYADLEKLPFPPDVQARMGDDGVAWGQTLVAIAKVLPETTLIISDDYPAAEAVRRRAIASAGRGMGAHPFEPTRKVLVGSGSNLAEGLDGLCRQTGRVWWRSGNTIHFRSQFWCSMQRYIPPPNLVKRVHSVMAQIGDSSANTEQAEALVVALAGFSFEQLQGFAALPMLKLTTIPATGTGITSSTSAFLAAMGTGVSEKHWSSLQLFARLTPDQRRMTLSPAGVPLDDLSADQWSWVQSETRTAATSGKNRVPPAFRVEILSVDGRGVRAPSSILPPGRGLFLNIKTSYGSNPSFLYLSLPIP